MLPFYKPYFSSEKQRQQKKKKYFNVIIHYNKSSQLFINKLPESSHKRKN